MELMNSMESMGVNIFRGKFSDDFTETASGTTTRNFRNRLQWCAFCMISNLPTEARRSLVCTNSFQGHFFLTGLPGSRVLSYSSYLTEAISGVDWFILFGKSLKIKTEFMG